MPVDTAAGSAGWSTAHGDRAWRALFFALAAVFVAWALIAMWRYGVRDLYADQWRLYFRFLTMDFVAGVVALDNGHRPVLPNLLRAAEAWWFGTVFPLQLLASVALLLFTLVMLCRVVAREQAAPMQRAPAAAACATIAAALCWMATVRTLLHPFESVHAYVTTAAIAAATASLWHALDASWPARRGVMLGVVFALVATLSFGTGMALFPASLVALVASRAPWSWVAGIAAGWLVAAGLYFSLPGGSSVEHSLHIEPLRNLSVIAAWLGSAPMHMALPWLDPSFSYALPFEVLHQPSWRFAGAWSEAHGSVWTTRTPQMLAGGCGATLLLWSSWRVWRRRQVTSMAFVGLMLGWFSLGAGALVSLSRLDYFDHYPEQLYANRYLLWPCLFWAGVVLLQLPPAQRQQGLGARPLYRHVALTSVVLACLVMLLTNPLWTTWGKQVQVFARTQTAAFALGLVGPAGTMGETQRDEVMAALDTVRARHLGTFGHPALQWLGRTIPSAVHADTAAQSAVQATPDPSVDFLRGQGWVAQLRLPEGQPRRRSEFWLIADGDGRVVGLAHPNPLQSKSRLRAIVPREASAAYLLPWDDERAQPGTPQPIVLAPALAHHWNAPHRR